MVSGVETGRPQRQFVVTTQGEGVEILIPVGYILNKIDNLANTMPPRSGVGTYTLFCLCVFQGRGAEKKIPTLYI